MGASWKTLAISILVAIVQYFASLGTNFPKTGEDWGHVLLSAGIVAWGAVQKDWNVSNSPDPAAATVVSAKSESTINPMVKEAEKGG